MPGDLLERQAGRLRNRKEDEGSKSLRLSRDANRPELPDEEKQEWRRICRENAKKMPSATQKFPDWRAHPGPGLVRIFQSSGGGGRSKRLGAEGDSAPPTGPPRGRFSGHHQPRGPPPPPARSPLPAPGGSLCLFPGLTSRESGLRPSRKLDRRCGCNESSLLLGLQECRGLSPPPKGASPQETELRGHTFRGGERVVQEWTRVLVRALARPRKHFRGRRHPA